MSQQFIRECSIIFASKSDGIYFSDLRIAFQIQKTELQTPNAAKIVAFNLSSELSKAIKKEFDRVILTAGYKGSSATIFDGNIKNVMLGEEGVDSFLEIDAGDGDQAYNYSFVSKTLASGATQKDIANEAASSMAPNGVKKGVIEAGASNALARGKVIFSAARDVLRGASKNSDAEWSIQDRELQMIKKTGVLPGYAVRAAPDSGLIGIPTTNEKGISFDMLLNSKLRPGGQVVVEATENTSGIYRLIAVDHVGDTHGSDWRSTCQAIKIGENT